MTRRPRTAWRRLAAACLCAPLAAHLLSAPMAEARVGDRLTGYGKLLFGMTAAELEALSGVAAQPRADGAMVIETTETIAGMPATRSLVLREGRLVSILFDWTLPEAGGESPALTCPAVFGQLFGQITLRYGDPAIGPNPRPSDASGGDLSPTGGDGGAFAATSFWSFPDGASIALIVRGAAGADGSAAAPAGCRATVNYREPPPDARGPDRAPDAATVDGADGP